ncbi:unnamed protein product [Porites evermanni]|uniref:Dolichyldiphosphatase n=2 Tax=Porites TaxID=46719 RepID=A0ABN8M1H8_9CNID|nr:unnamed protein product [Porites evermanni]
MDSDAILTFPLRKASWIKRVAEIHGIFNMAEDTLRRSCENGDNSYLFDLAGNNVKWKTISLTHVEYPEGDFVGKVLAWCSLLPIFILVGFITLIIFRRELHTMTFLLGILVNEVVNLIVKHTLAYPRLCADHVFPNSSYAMPSDHAQFMAFFAVYSILFIYIRLVHFTQSTTVWDDLIENLWRHLVAVGVVLAAVAVGFSRIYLRYHTLHQVCYGFLLGSAIGVAWFMFTQTVLTPLFPTITTWPLCEYLMVRDSTLIPSVMWFEYTQSRTEMK